jgi:hypothetical protein
MAMLRICAADGCEIKTLGELCIHHEPARTIPPKQPVATWAESTRPKAAV